MTRICVNLISQIGLIEGSVAEPLISPGPLKYEAKYSPQTNRGHRCPAVALYCRFLSHFLSLIRVTVVYRNA